MSSRAWELIEMHPMAPFMDLQEHLYWTAGSIWLGEGLCRGRLKDKDSSKVKI